MSRAHGRCRAHRWLRSVALTVLAGGFLMSVGLPTHAQDRHLLSRVLNGDADFRVRVQAAFALGNTRDPAVIPPLERALRDNNPAVRAAAATALGRIGSDRALPALRRATRDDSAAVRLQVQRSMGLIERGPEAPTQVAAAVDRSGVYPTISVMPTESSISWPRVRYVVFLGDMNNRSGYAGGTMAGLLRTEVGRHLQLLRGVAVMQSPSAVDARARREMDRRRLPKLRLDGNVVALERRQRGRDLTIRCEVSLMLLDEPQRSLRGELRGAASGTEIRRVRSDQEIRLAQQALQGAVRSAMSNAPQAFARAAGR